jgi:hypothetical protein
MTASDPFRSVAFLDSGLSQGYSITSSARTSSACGIVRPSALGVFTLITNSNFVGCSNREIARLRALENLIHAASGATVEVGKVHSIGHQTSKFHRLANGEHAWQPSASCKVHDKSSNRRKSQLPPFDRAWLADNQLSNGGVPVQLFKKLTRPQTLVSR